LQIVSERGYLIPAVNTENKNYIACAQQLAHSIKQFHPEVKICLLTDAPFDDSVFDYVRFLPHGDLDVDSHWKLSNDWQCYTASPFRQTIKVEADMIASSPIDHWWTLLEKQDLVVSVGCRNYYDGVGDASRYRKQFETNSLPDVYNAITYWRLSSTATSFFRLVREIFTHWDKFRTLLKFSDNEPTTDIVYAMAVKILGIEKLYFADWVRSNYSAYEKICDSHCRGNLDQGVSLGTCQPWIKNKHNGSMGICALPY
jgi:hypothetical protein